jgi:hypothetical protein
VTEVEHFLPREQIFANTCSLGSFHFFDSCDKNLMGVFIFFYCCDKNLIVLSRQLLIPLNSSKDDNSFVIIFLFLKFEIFVLFLLPTVKKIVYILLERMLIFPSVLCSPLATNCTLGKIMHFSPSIYNILFFTFLFFLCLFQNISIIISTVFPLSLNYVCHYVSKRNEESIFNFYILSCV